MAKKPTKQEMIRFLKYQMTDMDRYDPRSEMEEGEHIFGALARREAREEKNKMLQAIIDELRRRK